MIRSQPAGAMVYVDDYEKPLGATPVATNFTYYGTRKIRLVKDGYETLTVLQPVSTPWYEIPPLDLISENLIPGKVRDQRTFCYQLAPQVVVPADQLMQRAEGLRAQGRTGAPGAPSPQFQEAPPPSYPTPNAQSAPGSPDPTLPPGGWPVPGGQ